MHGQEFFSLAFVLLAASLLVVGVFSHGMASLGLYLLPLVAGIMLELIGRRRQG